MHTTLTDFGLSRLINNTVVMGTRTMMAGTPGYQSPEQLRAQSVGPPTDVYAFGCIVLVTYSGKQPWSGFTPYQIMLKVTVEKEKPDTSDLPPSVKSICDLCIADDRPSIIAILQSLLKLC
jgi:serine/threonine protein kinase